jgi:hypothetical protein
MRRLVFYVLMLMFLFFNDQRWRSASSRVEQMEEALHKMESVLRAFIASGGKGNGGACAK